LFLFTDATFFRSLPISPPLSPMLFVLPYPSFPSIPSPQHRSLPFSIIAQLCLPCRPGRSFFTFLPMFVTPPSSVGVQVVVQPGVSPLFTVSPTPSCPASFCPQHQTLVLSSSQSAHEWCLCVTSCLMGHGTGTWTRLVPISPPPSPILPGIALPFWPYCPHPQQNGCPLAALSAHVCSDPPVKVITWASTSRGGRLAPIVP